MHFLIVRERKVHPNDCIKVSFLDFCLSTNSLRAENSLLGEDCDDDAVVVGEVLRELFKFCCLYSLLSSHCNEGTFQNILRFDFLIPSPQQWQTFTSNSHRLHSNPVFKIFLIDPHKNFSQNCFDKLYRSLQSYIYDLGFMVLDIGSMHSLRYLRSVSSPHSLSLCLDCSRPVMRYNINLNISLVERKSINTNIYESKTVSMCSPHGRSSRYCRQRASSTMECSTIYHEQVRRAVVHTSSATMSVRVQRDLSQPMLAHNLCFE